MQRKYLGLAEKRAQGAKVSRVRALYQGRVESVIGFAVKLVVVIDSNNYTGALSRLVEDSRGV